MPQILDAPHPKKKRNGRANPRKRTTFCLRHDSAKSVALVGTFTGWQEHPLPMSQIEPGIWSIEIELPPGKFEYLFLANGSECLEDPAAADYVINQRGGRNSLLILTADGCHRR